MPNISKTPSVLAFERILNPSDASFSQKDSNSDRPVEKILSIIEKSVRGTISNRANLKGDDFKKNATLINANLQTIDTAYLDSNCDTLCIKWSLKVLPFNGTPNVCNDLEYQKAIQEIVAKYKEEFNLDELAARYAENIANGRWLWRNRLNAKNATISVKIDDIDNEKIDILQFNALSFSLAKFNSNNENLSILKQFIKEALMGKLRIFNIKAEVELGYGQEVYPSQELVLDSGSSSKNSKSKILFSVGEAAGMHSQKLGNAIRTIDTWYIKDELNADFPIAIEPYGAVTTLGKAFRIPSDKLDFYTILDNWMKSDKIPGNTQQHFIMAMLIRGGIFGESSK
ncbi:MAG: type I-F CRISPR-associated protein Csy3 [Psittacicella sp.]